MLKKATKTKNIGTGKQVLGTCDTPALTQATPMKSQKVTYKQQHGVDYLTATIKKRNFEAAKAALQALLLALHIEKTCGEEQKRHGYVGCTILHAHGFAGVQGGRAMIELPGRAIDTLRARGFDDFRIVKAMAGKTPWRASRIDFCVDTRNPEITPAQVEKHWNSEHVTCKAGNIRVTKETRPDGRQSHTVYIGSNASMRMLRIYDKATQMEFVHGIKGEPSWTRFELQCRHEVADATLTYLQDHGVEAGKQLMNGWIRFLDPKSRATREENRKTAQWWLEIVGVKKAL